EAVRNRTEKSGSRQGRFDGGLHFFQAGAGHGGGVLFPVVAVEQFQRQDTAKAAVAQGAEDGGEGSDAVAGIDAGGVGDIGAGRFGRIVVAVEDVEGGAVQQVEAG